MADERHPRAVELDEELRQLARECEYTDGAGFPDDDPEYGDTIEGLIEYKNALESRLYDAECKLADATKQPEPRPVPEGHRRLTVVTDCDAYLRETWEVDVPEDLREYDDVEGYVERVVYNGDAHLVDEQPDGERNRTITRIDDD